MPGVNITLFPRNLCVDWEVNKMSRGGDPERLGNRAKTFYIYILHCKSFM